MKKQKSSIYIAYTGGTIGMARKGKGYRPEAGHLERSMGGDPRFTAEDVPGFTVEEIPPLLDSADMTPPDWTRIARKIADNYQDYDGFLVLHGTDTMSYTASALSFMLEGLGKPVVLTGSQLPLFESRTDAEENLLTSLIILGEHHRRMNEVFLYFSGKLYRGNRTTKVNADAFNAFASPNYPEVATAGVTIQMRFDRLLPPDPSKGNLSVAPVGDAAVTVARLFPGIRASHFANVLAPPVQGVVLECFGTGNGPASDRQLIKVIEDAAARGVTVVAVTQPLQGRVDLGRYATGRALRDAGVLGGADMTTEAALAKLYYLLEQGHDAEAMKALMERSLRGELTSIPGG